MVYVETKHSETALGTIVDCDYDIIRDRGNCPVAPATNGLCLSRCEIRRSLCERFDPNHSLHFVL
ncbi:hypothetical protein CA13_24940 [Planctomycetes bacterium CA13]|uniref:Uncharacterized protein n=1 Tax=Novipirellula herctigrandis TaxID=2527986 RepID=A0A5C5Z277_9BACT|nr:hypothetical protein CA13_24940 [Planctomycetes bacterium CA13]